jgi:uncharacterized LabA/DUF88 family protein
MAISGPPYSGPREVRYLFVDGGSLRGKLQNISTKFFGGAKFEIDFSKLTQGFTKTFYYDAVPVRENGEAEDAYRARIAPTLAVFDAAASVDGVHVYEGDARQRKRQGLVQKKVDVKLAVDMLSHAFRRNMHQATLLTGDIDFQPLVEALVESGLFVTLWYPTDETSRELMQAADARQQLNIARLHSLLTPSSQTHFRIPVAAHHPPSIEPGTLLKSWEHDGKAHALYQDGRELIVTREHDANNRLHVRHENKDLLHIFCRESHFIEVPTD